MRTKNSAKNMTINIAGHFITVILSFVTRSVFIKTLQSEYLGINGLFTDILSLLSLAELGVGNAIIYSMYKPIAEDNKEKIKSLMRLYKRAYEYIGIVVFIIGISIMPFMEYIIKNDTKINNLLLIYFLYLINTVSTYFIAYKRSLIIANQKMYIINLYNYILNILKSFIQMAILYLTHSFIIYLLIQILFSIGINFIINKKADKMYPYLLEKDIYKLDAKEMKQIGKNISAVFSHKLGATIVFNTDSMLMSKFIGIVSVGIYSNYILIIKSIETFLSQITNSFTASVGNLGAIESQEKTKTIYNALNFFGAWIYGFCTICLFVLINPFISIWIGERYLFNLGVVFLLIVNFYVKGMRQVTIMFKDAFGLFWHDRYKPPIEAALNLFLSIFFIKHIGISGIFIGTFLSTILTSFWIEPFVLFKHGFKSSVVEYFLKYFKYTIVTVFAGALAYLLCSSLVLSGFMEFIGKVLICIFIPNIIFLIAFYKTNEFKYLYNIVKGIFVKILVRKSYSI